jgi:hypothetical protein
VVAVSSRSVDNQLSCTFRFVEVSTRVKAFP